MAKNRYIGKWEERGWKVIDLPFTPENLEYLLSTIITGDASEFVQQDVVNWCDQYFSKFLNEDEGNSNDLLSRKVQSIVRDISAQWDLFLSNSYSLEQLQALDFSEVELPIGWFVAWLDKLRS